MSISSEDVKLIEKYIDIKNRGYYADGRQVTDLYNRILDKRLSPTSCGSCIRHRIGELEQALNKFKKEMEAISSPSDGVKEEPQTSVKDEVKKTVKTKKKGDK